MAVDAKNVVEAVLQAFQGKARPSPEQVEAVMRPFGVISDDTEREIHLLLHERGMNAVTLGIGCWMEANFVASGEGDQVERKIQFLLGDTCTCVLDHLPKAIEHATRPVDPRISALLNHEYLRKK
jgi:hypothetical protein